VSLSETQLCIARQCSLSAFSKRLHRIVCMMLSVDRLSSSCSCSSSMELLCLNISSNNCVSTIVSNNVICTPCHVMHTYWVGYNTTIILGDSVPFFLHFRGRLGNRVNWHVAPNYRDCICVYVCAYDFRQKRICSWWQLPHWHTRSTD